MAGRLTRGEVRLLRFPAPDKLRPVVVLTENLSIPLLTRVTVAPITSSVRGVPSEVILNESDGMKKTCALNLHNITTVEQEQLGRRVGQLSEHRMRSVCSALRFALGCEDE